MTLKGTITQVDIESKVAKLSYIGHQYPGRVKLDYVESPDAEKLLIELLGNAKLCTITIDEDGHLVHIIQLET